MVQSKYLNWAFCFTGFRIKLHLPAMTCTITSHRKSIQFIINPRDSLRQLDLTPCRLRSYPLSKAKKSSRKAGGARRSWTRQNIPTLIPSARPRHWNSTLSLSPMALLCLRPIPSRLSLLSSVSASASSRVTLLHLSKCYFSGLQPKRLFRCRGRAARHQSEDDYDYVEEEEEGFGDDGYLFVRLSLSLPHSLTDTHWKPCNVFASEKNLCCA